MEPKKKIKSLELHELEEEIIKLGETKFRAKQIFEWLHKKNVGPSEMTNISKQLQTKLLEHFEFEKLDYVRAYKTKNDNTTKYLFDIGNNNIIESVFMPYNYGNTVCVSSQAGCRMGCSFCASSANGLYRNLTSGEMLTQIYDIQKMQNEKVSNVVIMGMGEPLDNYFEVLKFMKILNAKDGLNIGQRHITLSTCGIVDGIYTLAEENLQITLAVSLHAPNDDIRRQIMPIAKRFTIDDLLEACKKYENKTKRRITFEYAMIKDLNDSKNNAYELAKKLKHTLCHVNLIPLNEVAGKRYSKSPQITIEEFSQILKDYGIETTIRRKLGSDINAACGQLRLTSKELSKGL